MHSHWEQTLPRRFASRGPCLLKFEGNDKELTKAEKLIKSALSSAYSENGRMKITESPATLMKPHPLINHGLDANGNFPPQKSYIHTPFEH